MANDLSRSGVKPANPGKAASPLRKAITGPLLFLFILGDVLGAGVYALMGVLAGKVGGALWLPMLVALFLAMLTAGSYAELVTKYPRAGGAAVFAQRAFKKPMLSFLVGFSMLAAGLTSAAGLSLAFSGSYLSTFISVPQTMAAVVFLALVSLLNARGIKESLKINVGMTLIELSGLVIVMIAGAYLLSRGSGDVSRVLAFPANTSAASATLAGAVIAYYAFVGFETSANVAEEMKDPARSYAPALFGSLLVAGVIYVGVGLAASVALPPAELAASTGPLLAVVDASGLGVPNWVFSFIALIAVANGAMLTMIMASRLTYGMADEGLLPRVLARVLPERRTPWVAILATTLVAMALTLIGDLSTLAETVVLLLLFVFISTNAAVIVLRREPVAHEHFRVWTVMPYLGIASCFLLMAQQSGHVWALAGLFLVVGVGLYGLARLGVNWSVPSPPSA